MSGHATGEMFIGDHVQLNIGFAAARTGLGNLASGGVLLGASEHGYGETITGLAEAGSVPGVSQLAGVRPGDLTATRGTAQLPVHCHKLDFSGYSPRRGMLATVIGGVPATPSCCRSLNSRAGGWERRWLAVVPWGL
jgi:hypothetical protein